jgi:DNA-3-methyladenine glycosylase II
MMFQGQTIAFRLNGSSRVDDENDVVDYELMSESAISPEAGAYVANRASFFLSLQDDLRPFYAIAKEKDPKFYPIVEENWGLHHVKFLTLLEIACWAILSQRAPIPIARKMKRALVEKYGGSIEVDGVRYWAFPDYSRVKGLTLDELTSAIRNVRKAGYLSYLLTSFRDVDEEFLRTGKYEEAEAWLKEIRGIGDWSAAFILLRGLGRMERLPFNLKPVLRGMAEIYGPGQTMEEIARIYGPWIGYWSYYLRTSV